MKFNQSNIYFQITIKHKSFCNKKYFQNNINFYTGSSTSILYHIKFKLRALQTTLKRWVTLCFNKTIAKLSLL